jgi:hypothetical protein
MSYAIEAGYRPITETDSVNGNGSHGKDKKNHKGMDEKTRGHPPEILKRYLKGWGYEAPTFDIGRQGGLIRNTDGTPAGYLRPPIYRSIIGPDVTKQDVRPVTLKD